MNSLLNNEVLVWRLAGSAVWQTLTATLVYIAYSVIKNPLIALSPLRALGSIFHFNNWISVVSLLLTLAPAAAAYTAVMSTVENATKHRAGLKFLPPQFAALFRKVTARSSSPQAAATWLAFLVGHVVSAMALFYRILPSKVNLCKYCCSISKHIIAHFAFRIWKVKSKALTNLLFFTFLQLHTKCFGNHLL
jgi:hypothetical protein